MSHPVQSAARITAFLIGLPLAIAALPAPAQVGSGILAVPPERLSNYWVMTNTSLDVDVPNRGKNLDKPTCAAVTYMIGSDGRTRDVKVRRVVPEGDLDIVAASAVKDMRYDAGPDNKAMAPVFTYIIVPFNLPNDPAARKRITDACTLADFPQDFR